MTIRLYDTLTDRKVDFVPHVPGEVRLYVCGPTVYDMSHLGHARCYVAWDVVVRHLRWRGFKVTYCRNFTDVDDKIIRRANERGEEAVALAARYADEYHRDMDSLSCVRPDVEPRVSTSIPEILAIIEKLIARGHAYAAGGDVYFAVRSFPDYLKLSHRNLDDLKAGARVEPDEKKRDPLDFALWKAAKPGEPTWESPWGKGRPGWHIECSAMSARHLGETFDLHAGGKDLVFPHHENEIAQSEAANGPGFAKYWMHNGFVNIDNEKMSKSLGNFATIRDTLQSVDGQALRLFLLGTHYRGPINFSAESLLEAEKRVEYIYETLAKVDARLGAGPVDETELHDKPRVEAFLAEVGRALDDDFNSAEVLGILSPYLTWMNELGEKAPAGASKKAVKGTLGRLRRDFATVAGVLGVGGEAPAAFLVRFREKVAARKGIDVAAVEALIAARIEARKAKDFARADALRADAAKLGVEIQDTPGGTTWRVL